MVAGIVLVALGLEQTLAHIDEPPDADSAFALLGGTAIYLLAHVALRLRNAHSVNPQRLAFAVTLLALVPAATEVDALATLAAVNVAIWAMIAFETRSYGAGRYRLRHRLTLEPPPPGEAG
jgi:low temperature requirement protein LtrA